ncbi:MAG: response regulator transcription factor [Acidimicrobiia bacterium]|nr:MAG: response regulator transcription factor [Acidimicrobiia bacterium]
MKILIVDDHKVVRDGIRYMLSDAPDIEIVGEAASAEAMFEIIDTVPIDVMLLDIRMEGITGLDALERISKDFPQIKVLMMSMHDQPGYVRRALELGASGYLLKSVGRDEVLAAISAAVEGETYIHGSLMEPLLAEVAGAPGHTGRLSPREQQVLQLIANGSENKQIARELELSEATVKTYIRGVFERLEVSSRAEAVAVGLRLGVIE